MWIYVIAACVVLLFIGSFGAWMLLKPKFENSKPKKPVTARQRERRALMQKKKTGRSTLDLEEGGAAGASSPAISSRSSLSRVSPKLSYDTNQIGCRGSNFITRQSSLSPLSMTEQQRRISLRRSISERRRRSADENTEFSAGAQSIVAEVARRYSRKGSVDSATTATIDNAANHAGSVASARLRLPSIPSKKTDAPGSPRDSILRQNLMNRVKNKMHASSRYSTPTDSSLKVIQNQENRAKSKSVAQVLCL